MKFETNEANLARKYDFDGKLFSEHFLILKDFLNKMENKITFKTLQLEKQNLRVAGR